MITKQFFIIEFYDDLTSEYQSPGIFITKAEDEAEAEKYFRKVFTIHPINRIVALEAVLQLNGGLINLPSYIS